MRGTQILSKLVGSVFGLGLMIAASGSLEAKASEQNLPICYIPGAGGGTDGSVEQFPREMTKRGISFLFFDIGNIGTVVERAQKLARLMEVELDKNPKFRCHFFAYSMGGVVSRYFYNHLDLTPKSGQRIEARAVMASLSTYSSPHRGTPLADWLKRYAPKYAAGMDDLSEEKIKIYNEPEYPETYSPAPTSIPVYSFLTYLEEGDESNSFLGKFGFKVIWETYKRRGLDPRNDGIIPLVSQALGKVAMTIRAPHGFFSHDVGLRPWAPDVFESQYHMLNESLDALVENGRLEWLLSSPRINTEEMGLDNLDLVIESNPRPF